jgi:hypothetical protein
MRFLIVLLSFMYSSFQLLSQFDKFSFPNERSQLLTYLTNHSSIPSEINKQSNNVHTNKYFAVHHGVWGRFMNDHAVWIDNMVLCNEGIPKELYFTTPEFESGLYEFEIAADDNADLYIDNMKVTSFSSFGSSEKFKMKLDKGIHEIKVVVHNNVLSKTNWIENAVGVAIVIRNQQNVVLLSSRDAKFCDKLTSNPITYPMNRGIKLMQDHGVWINFLGSLELDKPVEISWEYNIHNEGLHSFYIQPDNVADIYIDGQFLDKVIGGSNETIINYFLSKGRHSLKVVLINQANGNDTWDANAGGIAILIKNKSGENVFSSRDYASPIPEHFEQKNIPIKEKNVTEHIPIQTKSVGQNTGSPQNVPSEEVFNFLRGSKWKIIKCDCGIPILDYSFLGDYYVFNNLNIKTYSEKGAFIGSFNFSISNVKRLSTGLLAFTFKLPLTIEDQKSMGREYDKHTFKVIDNNTMDADIEGCKQVLIRVK